MDMGRPLKTNVIAIYNVPFVILYSSVILAVTVACGVASFTGESIEAYLFRKPAMVPFVIVIVVGAAVEIPRCAIMLYNILINSGKALFVRDGKIVFISRYFTSIQISQIVKAVPIRKKTVHIVTSTGKTKKIYTSFLRPSDPNIVAKRIEALVHGVDGE